jgi:hypothetical protein
LTLVAAGAVLPLLLVPQLLLQLLVPVLLLPLA